MRIQTINYNNYNLLNKKSCSFDGLKKHMEKNVMAVPATKAEALVRCYSKPYVIVGHFPDDIFDILKKKSASKSDLNSRIQKFNTSFSQNARKITSFDDVVIEKVRNMDLEDYFYKALNKSIQKKQSDYIGFVAYPIKWNMTPEEEENLLNNDSFTNTMKEIGLIPEDGKVRISFVGEGTFKKCYKVSFSDENDESIIHPKALVIGKNPNLGKECDDIIKARTQKYFDETSYEEFSEKMTARAQTDKSISASTRNAIMREMRPFYDKKYKTAYIYNGPVLLEEFTDINGIFPEANASLKIRKDLGKTIRKSNMITPYIFDLKNKFGLLEFADYDLEKTQFNYDFAKHGLCWIDNKEKNFACGNKVVDYGCIFPDTKSYCE